MRFNRSIIFIILLILASALNLFLDVGEIDFSNLIFKLRLLRVSTALIAGGSLAVCGLVLQTWFRNSLADPFLLGVNSGANLLIALGVFWGESYWVQFRDLTSSSWCVWCRVVSEFSFVN